MLAAPSRNTSAAVAAAMPRRGQPCLPASGVLLQLGTGQLPSAGRPLQLRLPEIEGCTEHGRTGQRKDLLWKLLQSGTQFRHLSQFAVHYANTCYLHALYCAQDTSAQHVDGWLRMTTLCAGNLLDRAFCEHLHPSVLCCNITHPLPRSAASVHDCH